MAPRNVSGRQLPNRTPSNPSLLNNRTKGLEIKGSSDNAASRVTTESQLKIRDGSVLRSDAGQRASTAANIRQIAANSMRSVVKRVKKECSVMTLPNIPATPDW